MNDLEKIRNDYTQKTLDIRDVAPDPISQFETWFNEVMNSEVAEPTACILSTASKDGKPSGRVVLLKGFSSAGFRFFTNYESRKGQELMANPYASLTFFWKELERQVRVEGAVERLSEEDSEKYFKSRPLGSQIGAWASPQSQAIPDRQYLEDAEAKIKSQYGEEVPKPDHWGGFQLKPDHVEFWQGRSNRLHDRIAYKLKEDGWQLERLAP